MESPDKNERPECSKSFSNEEIVISKLKHVHIGPKEF